jgi:hypothetical protein
MWIHPGKCSINRYLFHYRAFIDTPTPPRSPLPLHVSPPRYNPPRHIYNQQTRHPHSHRVVLLTQGPHLLDYCQSFPAGQPARRAHLAVREDYHQAFDNKIVQNHLLLTAICTEKVKVVCWLICLGENQELQVIGSILWSIVLYISTNVLSDIFWCQADFILFSCGPMYWRCTVYISFSTKRQQNEIWLSYSGRRRQIRWTHWDILSFRCVRFFFN